MSNYQVVIEGLDALDNIEELEKRVLLRARQAINTTTRNTRAQAAKKMRQQVNFPARYLSGKGGKLRVDDFATGRSLQATITGRDQPTSLARFATTKDPKAARRKGGVTVRVQPGSPQFMEGAFLVKLKSGNLGLALRVKAGDKLRGKRAAAKPFGKGAYLLYGPSVDQVFAGVADDDYTQVAASLAKEFSRLMELDNGR